MRIDLSTVPGKGMLHHCRARDRSRFCLIVHGDGPRQIVVYRADDRDIPLQAITLDPDEADQVAELLHSAPILDRLAMLERRLDELGGRA